MESIKAIIESPETESRRRALQEEVNRTTYSPREESEKRQATYKKNEAEKAILKKRKASIKSHGL